MSSLTIYAQPAIEPVTLDEAKRHLRETDADNDALIVAYIAAARQHAEDFLGRALISRTYDYKLDDGWPCEIALPRPPLVSVTSVTYVDVNGATQTLSPSLYQVVAGMICGQIVPAYLAIWPLVRCQPDAITVRYVAGYGTTTADVPDAIRMAILMLVGHFYANRESVVVGSTATELPFAVSALLSPHKAYF